MAKSTILIPLQSLFVTPLEHYDFVIELNPAVLSRYSQAVGADPSVWESRMKYRNVVAGSEEIKVDFDPAWEYVQDLQVRFVIFPLATLTCSAVL